MTYQSRNSLFSLLKSGGSLAALAAVASVALTGAAAAQVVSGDTETVVVSGFKASLERALDAKREATGSSDSILAEDIAKFPDLNLSESIQRIPGVALNRSNGEGKQIAVRGLSPLFTTVQVDGMETITNSGNNVGRSFDFNVFDSDLFSGITVNKTSSADLHEGALGATVELSTAHPFDHQGFTLVGSGQGSYNDLNGAVNSRFSGLVSDTFLGGTLGVLFAGAYQSRNILLFDTDSVGFQNDNTGQTASHASPLVAGCETNVPNLAAQCAYTNPTYVGGVPTFPASNPNGTNQRFGSVTVVGTGLPGTITQVPGTVETNGNGAACPVGLLNCVNGNGPNYNASQKPNDYDVVNEAYHDRFPRYIPGHQSEKRTGFTGSTQWQPDDQTLFTLDALWSDLYVAQDNSDIVSPTFGTSGVSSNLAPGGAPPLKAPTLGLGSINVINYSVNEVTNNLQSLAATNVGLTSERAGTIADTRFTQVSLTGKHDFSNGLKVDGLVGWSQSHYVTTESYLFKMDYDCTAATSATGTIAGCPGGVGGGVGTASQPYIVNFPGSQEINFGNSVGQIDPTSPNGWFVTQYRNVPIFNYTQYHTASLHASYKLNDEITFEAGADYKNFGYRTLHLARFNGSTANLDSFIPTDIENAPLSSITDVYHLEGMGAPAGTATSWITLSPTKLNQLFGVFNQSVENYVWPSTSSASLACQTAGCPAFQLGPGQYLTSNGSINENDSSGWFMTDWDTKIGRIPFRGNIGVRYALTDTVGNGYNYDATARQIVPVTIPHTYHDWLPSANAVLEPTDDFLIRASIAEVMSRPNLPDLVPGISASKSGTGALTIGGGNALLNPYRAKDIDLSFEWYYDKGALFSIAFFYKHIDDLIATQNTNTPVTGNPFNIPTSIALAACGGVFLPNCNADNPANFQFKVNQKGSPLYGTEINWQQPFDFLPDIWANFGVLGNVTFVQARQNYLAANGSIQAVADLENMSRTSWNATFYYDDGTFQGRVSAAARSRYLNTAGVNPGNNNDLSITQGSTNIDASASYKFNDNLTFTFQGINLTNQPVISYLDSVGQRLNHGDWTGSEYYLGVRYAY